MRTIKFFKWGLVTTFFLLILAAGSAPLHSKVSSEPAYIIKKSGSASQYSQRRLEKDYRNEARLLKGNYQGRTIVVKPKPGGGVGGVGHKVKVKLVKPLLPAENSGPDNTAEQPSEETDAPAVEPEKTVKQGINFQNFPKK